MNRSVSGCVVDVTTGEPLTSPEVKLYRIGVRGGTVAVLDERGCFSFDDVSPGDYSLAFYDSKYVSRYERLTLAEGEPLHAMHVALKPGGFITGRIVDDKRLPPWRCCFTLIRAGERGSVSGYISDSGDHRVSDDGTFCSPPLAPGRYFLRFAGILREPPSTGSPEPTRLVMQERVFEFLYPDAQEVCNAMGFDVQSGQTISGLQIQIPCPVWHTVRGRVTGELPTELTAINVMLTRTMGTMDGVGWGGGALLQKDGTFECQVQSGVYSVEVCEFSPPEAGGRTHMLRKYAATNIGAINADLHGVAIHIPSGTAV